MSRHLASADDVLAHPHRYRLGRAGVLNVWQYDQQVFEFADGRLLLRGANGAGKSKTLEMLLPFVLDGDKLRMTASGRHHTSLLWLMTDGYDGQGRTGYLWVEFERTGDDGASEWFTCGVGVRASQSARTVSSWYFTSPRRVGQDLDLEDGAGPLTRERCRSEIEADGHFFDSPRQYKEHVGEVLFGLTGARYDELLRLLYWLRQPQVGEDIEPGRLAAILSVALPELDDHAVRSAGGTLDELAAFGEQLARRRQAAEAITGFAELYSGYACGVVADAGDAYLAAHRQLRAAERAVAQHTAEAERLRGELEANNADQVTARSAREGAQSRKAALESSPEAREHHRVLTLAERAAELSRRAERAAATARRTRRGADNARERLAADTTGLNSDTRDAAERGRMLTAAGAALGVHATLTVPASLMHPGLPDDVGALLSALSAYGEAAQTVRPAIGAAQAAVVVVDAARKDARQADRDRETAEREAARVETEAEDQRARLAEAEDAAAAAQAAYGRAFDDWRAAEHAVTFAMPEEISPVVVDGLSGLVRSAARPQLERFAGQERDASMQRGAAENLLAELRPERARIETDVDPAPAPPALGRTPRPAEDGAPLWRLVDFAPGLDTARRAGLEAAIESSGLLDAWIRRDGRVLDADQHDVVVPAGPAAPGESLAAVLVPDVPEGSAVSEETVRAVLARVGMAENSAAETDAVASGAEIVGFDGSWRLGPLTGRAGKPSAQYIGATAREAERARRLAEIDERITAAEAAREAAETAEQAARASIDRIESWLAAIPSHRDLVTAWTVVDERVGSAERAAKAAATAAAAAVKARQAAAGAHRRLAELAELHGLPITEDGLAARAEQLRGLERDFEKLLDDLTGCAGRLQRWQVDHAAWIELDRQAGDLEAQAADADREASTAAAEHDELQRAAEASVRELQERLSAVAGEIDAASAEERRLEEAEKALIDGLGQERAHRTHADEERRTREPLTIDAARRVAGLVDAPGLLESAGLETDQAAFATARGVTAGAQVPSEVVRLARELAAVERHDRPVTAAAVLKRHTEVISGPAADCEPRVLGDADPLAVVARDETGEYPLAVVAVRLTAHVEQDAQLLTERERKLFEDHVLGELGESLRSCRVEADELVAAMNRLLDGVSTSQGIRVTLSWRLRDDIPGDAKEAVGLLGRPVGALLPDERRALRDALHRLIDASRAEEPELSYTEHLGRALDYRQWFAFRIRYTRPELDGTWLDLRRKSPLSQGEQKVVCYLPLFAAAAAHFSSVAGAAPHAPRFVLLDDAFPKIDVRTHPLLFGLLVDLDLDFVVTSERLMGDHATVPSLAIYEALRDPAERGIAQYEYRWDGQRMHTVGV